ncbi:unnamed protein product [Rotaria sp. Silwood2]|nr:unnamed protein product [Rotaria sp. Silwood2]CAF3965411.1 unnamed protein product [Rotaria sp. Silwood2]
MQMDLIDMRSTEFNDFKWIFHAKDHFSKYSWLYPMMSKEATNVASILQSIFYQFGPPKILQSDNGREFVARVILDLQKNWPGLVIINGRPRHPQSQGLVERSNSVVQPMIGKWLNANNTLDWPSSLGPVMFAINTSIAKIINKTPFEIVFGQHPRTEDDTWKKIHHHQHQSDPDAVLLEEDLPDDVKAVIENTDYVDYGSDVDPAINNDKKISDDDNQVQMNDDNVQNLIIDHEECIGEVPSKTDDEMLSVNLNCGDRHQKLRQEATESYLKNAESQLIKYTTRSAKRQRTYTVGDIIGSKISQVDRTNTSPTILPCKIIEKSFDKGDILYTVATQNGVIKERFNSMMLLDLTTANFAALRTVNTDQLPTITFIQAAQIYTNFKSSETCKCSGDCNTNRCCCKKNNRKCCTKCHSNRSSKCNNC